MDPHLKNDAISHNQLDYSGVNMANISEHKHESYTETANMLSVVLWLTHL